MRKAKILALVLALLMVAAVFAACGKSNSPDGVLANYVDKTPTFTSATKLEVGGKIGAVKGCLARMTDATADGKTITRVFDLKESKTVLELTDTDTLTHVVELAEVGESVVIKVYLNDMTDAQKPKNVISLYDKEGTKIVESDKLTQSEFYSFADLIVFGESVYRVADNGGISLAFEHKKYEGALPTISYYTDNYYFAVNYDEVVRLTAYDKEMNLLSIYVAPSYAQSYNFFVMSNGNIFVQYRVALPDDARNYDIYNGTTKYELVTAIVDPDDGDADEIDFEYVVVLGYSRATARDYFERVCYADSIENVARCYPITDKRVNTDLISTELLVISNNGRVKGDLLSMIPNQVLSDDSYGERLSEDLFRVINASSERVLIDASGEVVANIGYNDVSDYNELYLVMGNVIYDHDMNKLLDLEEKGMTIETTLERSFILIDKDGNFYHFNGTAEPVLIDGDDKTEIFYFGNRIFVAKKIADDGKVTYTYYNDLGAAVLSDSEILLTYDYSFEEDGVVSLILNGTDSEQKPVYYIFK